MVIRAKQYSIGDVESRHIELSTYVARPLRLGNFAQPSRLFTLKIDRQALEYARSMS